MTRCLEDLGFRIRGYVMRQLETLSPTGIIFNFGSSDPWVWQKGL